MEELKQTLQSSYVIYLLTVQETEAERVRGLAWRKGTPGQAERSPLLPAGLLGSTYYGGSDLSGSPPAPAHPQHI